MGPFNKLAALLGGQSSQQPQPGQAPMGSGMADQARQIIMSRPYQLHMQEMKALGQEPMDPMQFMQMMQRQASNGPSI